MNELKKYDRLVIISLILIYLGLLQSIESINGTVWEGLFQGFAVIGSAWVVFKRASVKREVLNAR